MGEKSLAQGALRLLRDTVAKSSREAAAALDWARDQRDWLWPDRDWSGATEDTDSISWETLPALIDELQIDEARPPLFESIGTLAELVGLEPFDAALIEVAAGMQKLPRLAQLRLRLTSAGAAMVDLTGRLAGAPFGSADVAVHRSAAMTLGLLCIERDMMGPGEVQLQWRFSQLIDSACVDEAKLVSVLVGKAQSPTLERADFVEHAAEFDLLVRLLAGALRTGSRGINVLIYGPPGTGKTEFARTLAAEAGARLFAVGEADEQGDEPTRTERLQALHRAQHLLARRHDSILLFDEIEDLFTDSPSTVGRRGSGSKIFVNRLLEDAAVPVIWTSNSLAIDPAHLRRMSFVLRMDHPSGKMRERIAERVAEAEGAVDALEGLRALLRSEPESASIARVALRTAALTGGAAEDARLAGDALLRGMRGGRAIAPSTDGGELDLSLFAGETPIAALLDRVTADGAPLDFSLLLSGPPGTGKTALAAHLARRLDRPLAVKRASDLLSKWVGETEANIADAFADARQSGSVLLFDEADSLLTDRAGARASWEVTQVNELLTWMDNHPLPFIAATNFAGRLDAAVFRRFVFKVELRALSGAGLTSAFQRFFGTEPPRELHDLHGLTPGDFAVVRRKLRYSWAATTAKIVAMLRAEAEAKPGAVDRIGF